MAMPWAATTFCGRSVSRMPTASTSTRCAARSVASTAQPISTRRASSTGWDRTSFFMGTTPGPSGSRSAGSRSSSPRRGPTRSRPTREVTASPPGPRAASAPGRSRSAASRPAPSSAWSAARSSTTAHRASHPTESRSSSCAAPPRTPDRGPGSGSPRPTVATCGAWNGAVRPHSGRPPGNKSPTPPPSAQFERPGGSWLHGAVRARRSCATPREPSSVGRPTAAGSPVRLVECRLVAEFAAAAGALAGAGPLELSKRPLACPDRRREAAPGPQLLTRRADRPGRLRSGRSRARPSAARARLRRR